MARSGFWESDLKASFRGASANAQGFQVRPRGEGGRTFPRPFSTKRPFLNRHRAQSAGWKHYFNEKPDFSVGK
jgi:hypothetical protein